MRDGRMLVWMLLVVLATGIPLMLGIKADGPWDSALGKALRSLHAASSALLVAGVILHATRGGTAKGRRSGAIAFLSIGAAVVSGVMVSQTPQGDALLERVGINFVSVAIGHIAYASLVVVLAVYLHIARWGWRYVFSDARQAGTAVLLTGVAAILLGGSLRPWGGVTRLLVPDVAVLWAWLLLLPLVLYAVAFKRRVA